MSKFVDATGDEWDLRITAGHLRPLREDFGVDLRDALKAEDNSLADALGDPEKFVSVIYFLCDDQAQKKGVSPQDFALRMDGETLENAATALFGAVNSFFRPRTGDKAEKAFRTGLTRLSEAVGAAFDRLPEYLTSSAGASSSGEPPASTPGPSPSAN